MSGKKFFLRLLPLLLAIALFPALPASALDDDEFGGYAADELVIKVGYFGGPYYEKHVFTLEELWAMDVVYQDYTFIDHMPSVVIDHVAGVRLADLMDAAGIDLNSVRTFYFWTRDKQSDYYTSYTKEALIDTPRYCYYSLPDNFDVEEGEGNEYATSDGVLVDTVIALADDWGRCIASATFGSDYMNLNTNTRFRLIFGQTNGYERTAARSAKWIHEVVVELGGAPTLTVDASVLDGEIGSVLRTETSVSADSAVLENEKIEWSSDNESVAIVDENGNITIVGEGAANITASFAGIATTVTVSGIPGEETVPEETDVPPKDVTDEPTPTEEPTADIRPIQPSVETDTEKGGVQNWRVYEMSKTAQELGNIEQDNPLLGFTGIVAGALLIVSGAVYAVLFYKDVRRKKNVH